MGCAKEILPRPGVALGGYPERRVERRTGIEQAVSKTIRRWGSGNPVPEAAMARFVAEVDCEGAQLAQLSGDVLAGMAARLRAKMSGEGLSAELTQQTFALVREFADRRLGMRHFDNQVRGGWVMLNGMIAEMDTGEGKTLTATLPACCAGLAGIPVHVITANDYLAGRDAELMAPLYDALGLSVGVVSDGMGFDARQQAYGCDITYCTNKQVAFDYLRDRVERGPSQGQLQDEVQRFSVPDRRQRLLLRGLCFAIVDEADSVLIDDAGTPLILSRPMPGDDLQQGTYREALHFSGLLIEGEEFRVCRRSRAVRLTDRGRTRLAQLTAAAGGLWSGARRREELVEIALSASHLYHLDDQYLVRDGKVVIVDGATGRVMADRSWQRGLHQMIEVKEGCEPTPPKETLATTSYQGFFRKYLKLSGMTGTASEVRRELRDVYELQVVRIPTNRPCVRKAMPSRFFLEEGDKTRAIVESACHYSAAGRPVLIGTRSVAQSEQIGALLAAAGHERFILNARQDHAEADVVAGAGEVGRITVATNMAGRGTDIHLAAGVAEAGGLHVIVAAWNDSSRIDRQLIGRCARQGDPGSFQKFAALNDELTRRRYPEPVFWCLQKLKVGQRRLSNQLCRHFIRRAQRSVERQHRMLRLQLTRENGMLNDMLSYSGRTD